MFFKEKNNSQRVAEIQAAIGDRIHELEALGTYYQDTVIGAAYSALAIEADALCMPGMHLQDARYLLSCCEGAVNLIAGGDQAKDKNNWIPQRALAFESIINDNLTVPRKMKSLFAAFMALVGVVLICAVVIAALALPIALPMIITGIALIVGAAILAHKADKSRGLEEKLRSLTSMHKADQQFWQTILEQDSDGNVRYKDDFPLQGKKEIDSSVSHFDCLRK